MRNGTRYDAGRHDVRWVVLAAGFAASVFAVPIRPWGAVVALGMFAPALSPIAALASRVTRRTRWPLPELEALPSVYGVSIVGYGDRNSVALALADRVVFVETKSSLNEASVSRPAESTFRYCVGWRAFPVVALSCSAALWAVFWGMVTYPDYLWWAIVTLMPLVAGVAVVGLLGAGAYVEVSPAGLRFGTSSCSVGRSGLRARRLRGEVLLRWDEVLAMRSSGPRLRILSRRGCEYILRPPPLLLHPFGLLAAEREQTFLHIVAAHRAWSFGAAGPKDPGRDRFNDGAKRRERISA